MTEMTEGTRQLATAQEARLRSICEAFGEWSRLAFYHWARGDRVALARLAERPGRGNGNLAAFLAAAQPPGHDDPALCKPGAINKPWVLYYVARHWLRSGDIGRALDCGKRCLELTPGHSPVFSLIAAFAHGQGNRRLAQSLCDRLLEASPEQGDLRRYLERPESVPARPADALLRGRPPEIGYYVPVYNARQALPSVLDGILAQACPLGDFLVVDDGSTDDSDALAAGYPARLLRHDKNRGLAAARNSALKAMGSDYVGSCDSDAVLDPEYLIYAAIELASALLPPAGVGGRMVEQFTANIADSWRDAHLTQDSGPLRKCSAPGRGGPVYMPGCNTVLHRETVLALGGYHEAHVAVGEDGTLNRLLHARGHALATTPLARCRHLRRDTPLSVLRTRWNYEREGHEKVGAFSGVECIIKLFLEHLETAKIMAADDRELKAKHLLPMEVLYVYVLFLLSLRHAREEGNLSPGQEHWFQRALLHDPPAAAGVLRAWRDGVIAPLRLADDTPLEAPPDGYGEYFQHALAAFHEWTDSLMEEMDLSRVSATR